MIPGRLRVVSAAGAIPFVAFFAFLAVGALSNLWTDYKDSSDTTYLAVGGASLVAAAVLAGLAISLLRGAATATKVSSVALGVLLSLGGGFWLVAVASNPPDFRENAPAVNATPAGTPPATPSIATPRIGP
jgi:hypothetical protein